MPPLDFAAGLDARVRAARSTSAFPLLGARARGRRARRHLPVRVQRRQRGRGRRVPRRAHPAFSTSRGSWRTRSSRSRARRARSRRARRGRRGGAAARSRKVGARMSIFIAILGLALLILVHEAGHFFASLAVGLRPRRFYVGFPPAIVEDDAQRHRVRHRRDPARRLRDASPGCTGRSRTTPSVGSRARWRTRRRSPGRSIASGARSTATTSTARSLALDDFEEALRCATRLARGASPRAEKGLTELRDALGPDAYWKAATWRRLVAIVAGPAANILLDDRALHVALHDRRGQGDADVARSHPSSRPESRRPRRRSACRPATGSSRSTGSPSQARRDRRHDRRVRRQGARRSTVVRNGERADDSARSRRSSSTSATGSASASKAAGSASPGGRQRRRGDRARHEGDRQVARPARRPARGETRSRARSASRGVLGRHRAGHRQLPLGARRSSRSRSRS